eukprot:5584450-Pleurochrysis_carterae.AAC.1
MFLHAGTRFGSAVLKPELGVAGSATFSISTGSQARLNSMKAASESPGAAEAPTDAAREGVGPAEPTPAHDREVVATGTLPTSDGVIVEGTLPKDQPEDSDQSDVAQPLTKRLMFDELRSFADAFEVTLPRNYEGIPFEEGGPPLTIEQLKSLGMEFSNLMILDTKTSLYSQRMMALYSRLLLSACPVIWCGLEMRERPIRQYIRSRRSEFPLGRARPFARTPIRYCIIMCKRCERR